MPQKRKSKKSTGSVGQRLLTALTQQEIAHLLDAMLKRIGADSQAQMLKQLPSDTRQTVQNVLAPAPTADSAETAKPTPISLAKLAQTWAKCWQEWDRIVIEAAAEDGTYMIQEEHWEPPYFDGTAFVDDLEKVAEKMRPLLETAFQNQFAPELSFAEALLDAEQEIAAAMPEWNEIHEGFYLEKHLSDCLLHGQWLQIQDENRDAFSFAESIRQWEDKCSYVAVDEDHFLDYFTQRLSEADQKRILNGLSTDKQTPLWNECLNNTYSHWHRLYLYYIETYAPERHLDTLRSTITQRWQNSLPVIEDCLAKKNYQESLVVIEQTLATLLAFRRADQAWTPETSLLFPVSANQNLKSCKTLLRYYQQTAQGLGQSQRADALALQLHTFNHCFNWQSMFKAFAATAVDKKTQQDLFHSWQTYLVQRAKPYTGGFGFGKTDNSWWLYWLLESIFDGQKGPAWFQSKLTQWLKDLSISKKVVDEDFAYFRLLTHDVIGLDNNLKTQYPKFYDVVVRGKELSTPDDASRQTYLQQYAGAELQDSIMRYWQTHLHTWIPKPENSNMSNYTEHAQWMAALRELTPDHYKTVLAQWRVDHQRRRNLWQAMAKMGLD